MTDEEPTPLADLALVEKANWDASWAANNQQEVGEAYQRLVGVLERSAALLAEVERLRAQNAALREIAQAVAGTEAREITLVSPDDESYRDVGLVHETVNVLYIRNKARALLTDDA